MSALPASLPAGPSGVTRYLQLASVLRQRIANGHWRVGDRLPTVQQLASELGVARITVRQAYGRLAAEGLITTHRGRGTHVASTAQGRGPSPALRAAINDPLQHPPALSIRILDTQRDQALPATLHEGGSADTQYLRIRKLHLHDAQPFCLVDLYVAQREHDRFPPRAIEHAKLAGLLREHGSRPLGHLHQTMTVGAAERAQADALDYPFAAPVAHVVRRLTDVDGRIVYAGDFWYRGDRFVLDTVLPADLLFAYPLAVVPATRSET
ncbi:GntR family transcriptional regulator [Verticiella sediminum]|uniref:GntR family transcriptional regulator n=1 Tax=Verticiella sediminum TaxID=1247510 RepID=UPI001FEB1F12|nr:GntR family transcriptional regulator [Verticiella sediminum]